MEKEGCLKLICACGYREGREGQVRVQGVLWRSKNPCQRAERCKEPIETPHRAHFITFKRKSEFAQNVVELDKEYDRFSAIWLP
jgi:hypothetical protein